MIDSANIIGNWQWFVGGGGALAFAIVILLSRYLPQPQAARISAVLVPLLFCPVPFGAHNVFFLIPAQLWLLSGQFESTLLSLIPLSFWGGVGYVTSLWLSKLTRRQVGTLIAFVVAAIVIATGMNALYQLAIRGA